MRQQIISEVPNSLMLRMGRQLGAIPLVGTGLKSLYGLAQGPAGFRSSPSYWEGRYRHGGNSGVGSYGRLARFKAEILNHFVKDHAVASVVEFGCGDGAQLELAQYPDYTGFDISQHVIEQCRRKFTSDRSKRFYALGSGEGEPAEAEMAMSLDVIYHLVEDNIYEAYMRRLERAAGRFICVYSSNVALPGHVVHIRHRRFTDWFEANAPEWTVQETIRNAFPYDAKNSDETSWADFYFLSRNTR